MKKLLALAFVALFAIASTSCDSDGMTQTESGLQYKYLKKGDGPKVEEGSFVQTKLSLMVEDSVVWTTNDSPDSLFSFVVGWSPVIAGFEEMALLMREGDNVYVSIPDSLAYKETGAGDLIPPNATIVYNRYEMVSVSEPKKILTDTLGMAFQTGGPEQMVVVFESIMADGTDDYHMQVDLIAPFLNQLMQYGQYVAVEPITESFMQTEWEGDTNLFDLYYISSIQGQGRLDEAMEKAQAFQEQNPDDARISYLIEQLELQQEQEGN